MMATTLDRFLCLVFTPFSKEIIIIDNRQRAHDDQRCYMA